MHTATILASAPHLFKPMTMPTWMAQFFLSLIAVVAMDQWADRIPGVKKLPNRVPQILVLVTTATAVSTLQDTNLIGSLSKQLVNLSNQVGAGLSGLWNISGVIVAIVAAIILGFRYMNSEKLFWDGIIFGVTMTVLATLVPWVGLALEFWRFSVLTGICNLFVIITSWAAGLTIS